MLFLTLRKFYFKIFFEAFGRLELLIPHLQEFHTIQLNKTTFYWLRNQSIEFCEYFLKIPIFYGLLQISLNEKSMSYVELTKFRNCCQ